MSADILTKPGVLALCRCSKRVSHLIYLDYFVVTKLRRAVQLLLLLSVPAVCNAAEYRVAIDHLLCVQTNVGVYRELEKDTFTIVLEDCPNPQASSLLSALVAENPNLDDKFLPEDSVDQFILLRKDHLSCISELSLENLGEVVMFDPDYCSVRTYDE